MRLIDAFGNEVETGDTIITIKNASPKHWYISDCLLRMYVIDDIIFMEPSTLGIGKYYYYFKWRSKPVTLKDGREITVGGQSKKYKRLRYIERNGVKCPWIAKYVNPSAMP